MEKTMAAWWMSKAREEEHWRCPCNTSIQTCPHPSIHPSIPSTGECNANVCVWEGWFQSERMKRVGDLLAVFILVVHDAFQPQAGKILKDKVIVLGDAAGRGGGRGGEWARGRRGEGMSRTKGWSRRKSRWRRRIDASSIKTYCFCLTALMQTAARV